MLTTVTEEVLQAITQRIVDTVHPEKIILFGSYADGTATPDSDVDLLVVQETGLRHVDRTVAIRRHLRNFKVAMDILVYTPDEVEEWRDVKLAFVNRIFRQGKTVYEKSE